MKSIEEIIKALTWLFDPQNFSGEGVLFEVQNDSLKLSVVKQRKRIQIIINQLNSNNNILTTKNQTIMANYSKTRVAQDARTELHDALSLTGAEVSVNNLPAGAGVPFVHSHKQNEEIYAILSGKGHAEIDGETVELTAGDWLRIAPSAKRQFFAAEDSAISYICIQVKAGSLEGYTMTDAIV